MEFAKRMDMFGESVFTILAKMRQEKEKQGTLPAERREMKGKTYFLAPMGRGFTPAGMGQT